MDQLVETWPRAMLRGGPLSDDDDPGPRFRLRCWDRGIAFHDAGWERTRFGLSAPPTKCACFERLIPEVALRREKYVKGHHEAQGE
jgi:hypothetical protein